jgi:SAM-dependent methyltransferase
VSADGYMPQAVGPRTKRAIEARGLRPVVGDYTRYATDLLAGLPWTLRGGRGEFAFAGERHRYLFHPYNFTWLTERTVEVPIARAVVDRHAGKRILEVGNVLPHYGPHDHLVVDKYEQAEGVLNLDVMELDRLGRFDLVVCVSTVEHVGWDEDPREPGKAVEAVHRLAALLAPGGTLLLTVPVGYHPHLDTALQSGEFRFARSGALRRERLGPHWREASPADVWGTPYDFLLYSARAVFVGLIESP